MWHTLRVASKADTDFTSTANELFQSISRNLILAVGGIYLAWHIVSTTIWPVQVGTNVWLVAPVVALTWMLAFYLLPRRFLGAQAIWQAGLAAAITLSIYLFQRPEIAFFYAFLPFMAVVTVGWPGGLLAEGAVIALAWWLGHGLLLLPPPPLYGLGCVAGGAIASVLGWASVHALFTVAHWSLFSFRQAQQTTEQVRERRAELARALKELDQAYYRLERANHMLVLARAEAEEAREARNRFALAVSHELRTPLNFILGFSELMVNAPETYTTLDRWPPGLYEDAQEIYRSSAHLLRLVNDVLDLGQIEAMRMVLNKEWVVPAQIVHEVEAMVRSAFARKGLWLRMEVEADLPVAFLDRTRIRQVLLNLVSNSLRVMDRGGVTIRLQKEAVDKLTEVATTNATTKKGEAVDKLTEVATTNATTKKGEAVDKLTEVATTNATTKKEEAERVPGALLFCVQDTGPGIAKGDVPEVFEEFSQVSKGSWQRREGTGLGIPISRRFVELHGGRMWLESQVGQGTRFFFTIPFPGVGPDLLSLPAGATGSAGEINARYWRQLREKAAGARVLLVLSADPVAGEAIAPYVEGYGVVTGLVTNLSDPGQVCARVAELLPSALIVDQGMAREGEVDAVLRALPYDLPVISFVFPGSPGRIRDLPAGVASYLVKPVGRQELLQAVQALGPHIHHLLVVDDDPAMIRFVTQVFGTLRLAEGKADAHDGYCKEATSKMLAIQYRLATASTGAEALACLHGEQPDAVLLDLALPDISGWQVLEVLQQKGVPTILITAHDWPQFVASDAQEALRVVMRRPLSRRELAPVLKGLLETIQPAYPQAVAGPARPAGPSA